MTGILVYLRKKMDTRGIVRGKLEKCLSNKSRLAACVQRAVCLPACLAGHRKYKRVGALKRTWFKSYTTLFPHQRPTRKIS